MEERAMSPNALRRAAVPASVLLTAFLLLALPLAMASLLLAIALAGMFMVLILVLALGMERASILLMVLAFAFAPADSDSLTVAFLGISDVFFFLSLALAFPRMLRTPLSMPPVFAFAAAGFSAIALMSSVAANEPGIYYYTARVVFTFVILPMLVVWWAPRGKVLVWLLVAYAVGTSISVLYGLPRIGAYRNYGLSQHPNVLGYTTMLAVAVVPFLFVGLSRRWRYWICGAALGGAGIGILTSGSRAALLVTIVLILLVPAVERSIPLAITVASVGAIAITYIAQRPVPADGQDALSRLLGAGGASGSDQARVEGVERTWQVALDHPWLGTGFTLSEFNGHNVFVQVAAALGFIGLALFVVLLLSLVPAVLSTGNLHSRLIYPAIAVIGAGPVSPQLTDRYMGLLIGTALVGVNAVRAGRQFERDDPEDESPPPERLNRKNSSFSGIRPRSSSDW
jgi:O-antigen ligase